MGEISFHPEVLSEPEATLQVVLDRGDLSTGGKRGNTTGARNISACLGHLYEEVKYGWNIKGAGTEVVGKGAR